jgi:hypothetical protein
MSYNTVQNSLTTGFFMASSGANFNGILNVNNNLFVNNEIRNSSQNVKELVLNASNNTLAMRPYKESDIIRINENFFMNFCNWETVPVLPPVLPIIDTILYFITAPIGNNTIGKIIGNSGVFQLRSNNTDDIYAYNVTPEAAPINNLLHGLYFFIAGVGVRHFSIYTPLRCQKSIAGITGNGLSYELKFMLTASLSTSHKLSFGFAQLNACHLFDGNNLNSAPYSFGFVIDHSELGTYSIRPYVRNNSITVYADTAPIAQSNKIITLKINWDYENANCTFFVDNGTTSTTKTALTDFASNPSTSIFYDPFINVYNPGPDFGIILNKWHFSYYTYTI